MSYDPPAKQQKPFKQVTENHSHLQAQQAAGPLVMIVKHPLTDPHTTKEKKIALSLDVNHADGWAQGVNE